MRHQRRNTKKHRATKYRINGMAVPYYIGKPHYAKLAATVAGNIVAKKKRAEVALAVAREAAALSA